MEEEPAEKPGTPVKVVVGADTDEVVGGSGEDWEDAVWRPVLPIRLLQGSVPAVGAAAGAEMAVDVAA